MKYLATLLFFLGSFILRPVGADALSLQLTGPSSPVTVGSFFDIYVDVTDLGDDVLGFDLNVTPGEGLRYDDFNVGAGFDKADDPFGDIAGMALDPVTTSRLAVLHFQALSVGSHDIKVDSGDDGDLLLILLAIPDDPWSQDYDIEEKVIRVEVINTVPEPSTLLLLGSALLGLPVVRRFRKR